MIIHLAARCLCLQTRFHFILLDSMNRPLFRARNIDPSKRIRLYVDQHDDNNNDLSKSSSTGNLLPPSHHSSSTSQPAQSSSTSLSKLPQRAVPQMPFVSGMEREEEAVRSVDEETQPKKILSFLQQEYHLQNALDAQERLGSAKMRAVPIPSVYPDDKCQTIYPATVELPKEFIRLQRITSVSFSRRPLIIALSSPLRSSST